MRGDRAHAQEGPPAWKPGGDPLLGSVLSRYCVLGLLGRGGMGVVYRARDTQTGQEVALKLLATGRMSAGDSERFRREARAAVSLDHPNIAKVLEVGEHEGRPFLVLPLYEGETLKKRLDRAEEVAPMPVAEIVSIAAQLASALETAHSAGIIHRDLKPANLILTRGGRVKLLDFGLAFWEGSTRLTDSDGAVGTVAYMAPEQLRGEEVDARADLWAFGAVLYEMLAGRSPFTRGPQESLQDLMLTILEKEPPALAELRPETPPVLAAIVARCLQKDPAARFANAGEIVEALRGAAVLADPHPRPDRQSSGMGLWILLFVGVLLVLGLAVSNQLGPKDAIQVRVAHPEVQGLPEAETRRLSDNLKRALEQALRDVEGVAVTAPPQPAKETVTASAYCGPRICQVILHRLDAKDNRELWTETLQLPVDEPADLSIEMGRRMRRAYPPSR